MPSRYYPQRDMDIIDRFNRELVGDPKKDKCGIIDQLVYVYRVSAEDTSTNMYGEASSGKVYRRGVKLNCLIDAEDLNFETDDFGPDNRQNATFAFQRDYLVEIKFRPDIGDIISWNEGYFEINSFNENQLIGGDYNRNFSIVANAHLVRLPTLNIEEFRSI